MATETPPPPYIHASRRILPPREDRRGEIHFRHPGYCGPVLNLLLSLPRVDCQDVNGAVAYGIHHKTALTACQIIANNAFDTGYFALDQAGFQRVKVPLDGLLTEDQYFFVISGNHEYAVVPSFRDWRFPYEDIDRIWPDISDASNISNAPNIIGPKCCVSGISYAINRAHLLPQEEQAWFEQNIPGSSDVGLDEMDNIVLLKKDLHKCFDDRWFAIVPKKDSEGSYLFVTHILSNSAAQMWPTYQNVVVNQLSMGSKVYLFARFAWAILLRTKLFVNRSVARQAIRRHINDKGVFEYKNEELSGPLLKQLYGGGGSRNATPLKRKHAPTDKDSDGWTSETESDADGSWPWDKSMNRRDQSSSSDTVSDIQPAIPEEVCKELAIAAAGVIAFQEKQELE